MSWPARRCVLDRRNDRVVVADDAGEDRRALSQSGDQVGAQLLLDGSAAASRTRCSAPGVAGRSGSGEAGSAVERTTACSEDRRYGSGRPASHLVLGASIVAGSGLRRARREDLRRACACSRSSYPRRASRSGQRAGQAMPQAKVLEAGRWRGNAATTRREALPARCVARRGGERAPPWTAALVQGRARDRAATARPRSPRPAIRRAARDTSSRRGATGTVASIGVARPPRGARDGDACSAAPHVPPGPSSRSATRTVSSAARRRRAGWPDRSRWPGTRRPRAGASRSLPPRRPGRPSPCPRGEAGSHDGVAERGPARSRPSRHDQRHPRRDEQPDQGRRSASGASRPSAMGRSPAGRRVPAWSAGLLIGGTSRYVSTSGAVRMRTIDDMQHARFGRMTEVRRRRRRSSSAW